MVATIYDDDTFSNVQICMHTGGVRKPIYTVYISLKLHQQKYYIEF